MDSCAWVVAVVVLCVAFAHAQQLYEGDGCSLSDGGEGVCRTAASCPGVREQISGGVFPKICSFANNSQPIVCCRQVAGTTAAPPASQTTSTTPTPMSTTTNRLTAGTLVSMVDENTKAGRKCREYARYVYVEVVSDPSLRIPERYNKSECVMPAVEEPVFGGDEAIAKEFPHMAALGYGRKEDIQWRCGGTLISERFVLTVAHCVSSQSNSLVRWVRLGDLNLYSDEDDSQPITVAVAELIPHEEYKDDSDYIEIALLKLERDVTFSPYIRPACLYTLQGDPPLKLKATAIGWGKLHRREVVGSDTLKKIPLQFQDLSRCKHILEELFTQQNSLTRGIIPESFICAGDPQGQKDTCSGDSGGPLQIRLTLPDPFCMYSVVGLTAFGDERSHSSVYTRVSNYISWIERHVWP